MGQTDKIIAYDLGTGGIKASLYETDGSSCANTFLQYDTFYQGADIHEQRPMDWWDGIVKTTRSLLDKTKTPPERVAGLAISGHSLGAVLIDAEGRLLTDRSPIWSDKRAKAQAESFFTGTDYDRWYMTTGNGFPPECYTIFKIMWYRDQMPDLYEKADKVLGSKDFCNYLMTGRACTDNSYASGSGVYSLKDRRYLEEYVELSGINPKLLPEILPSHAVVGKLLPAAADALGLTTDTRVICGGVDNSCMALGARGIRAGRSYTSLGSSSWIAVIDHDPILDVQYKPFVFDHCVEGLYTSATSIFSAGNSFRWVRDAICPDLKAAEERGTIAGAYDEMNRMAEQSPLGANGLIFNPSLAGGAMIEESPDICGGYIGLNLGHTRNDLIRSAMEGITYNLYYAMTILKYYQSSIDEMLLVGGCAKSAFWRQMFADVFSMKMIKTVIDQDAASLGAAALAAYGLGYWDSYDRIDALHELESESVPDPGKQEAYQLHYRLHRDFAHYLARMGSQLRDSLENDGIK